MGRIKTRKIKAISNDLMEEHAESFGADFENNKRKVSELTSVESKKMRNIIAGYITRLSKTQK